MGSVIAIDHGEKRTGFAVSDPDRILVEPLEGWQGAGDSDALIEHIATLVAERSVSAFIIGYPYNMDGTEGPRSKGVAAFIERLKARFPNIAAIKQDERLTTKEAEELLREAGYFGEERKKRRDSWSALVILRDWIAAGEPGED